MNEEQMEDGTEMDENANTETRPPSIELGVFKPPTVDWSSIRRKIDVLLMTVNESEFDAVARIISNPQRSDTGGRLGPVYVGEIGKNYVSLVRSSPGTIGVAAAAATCQDAIETLKPKVIVNPGVCFGLQKNKQSLGDLLIAVQTAFYGPARINKDGSHYNRGPRPECAARLQRTFQDGKITWTTPGYINPKPKVHSGLVLSGPKLIDNEEETRRLQKEFPEALGGEMEADGIYSLCERKNIPWIVCKAICDWGDGTKDKKWQPYAAAVSASFVQNVLKHTFLPEIEDKDEVYAEKPTPKNCKKGAENNNDVYLTPSPSLSVKKQLQEEHPGETSSQRAKRQTTDLTRKYQEFSQKNTADSCHKEGKQQRRLGNYTEALRLHNLALSIRLHLCETIHKDTAAISYREIGKIHLLLRQYDLALLSFKCSLHILMNSVVYGEQHSETARGYYHVGEVLLYLRNDSSALCSLRKSLDIWKIQGGDSRKEIAVVYQTMGVAQRHLGDYAHANESLASSLEILQQLYATNHPDIARTCYEIGKLRSAQQHYGLSSTAFNFSLEILARIYGKASLESVGIHTEIGRLETRIGNYENAIRSHQQVLEIVLEKHNGADKYERVSNCHRDIAKIHVANGNFEAARDSYQSALDSITDNVYADGSQHIGALCADIYSEIADIHYRKREYVLSLEKYEQSLKINSNNVACSISIGNVYSTIGDYTSALEAYKRSLAIVRKVRGNNWEDWDETAMIYNKIGNAQLHLGNYDESLESLRSSLAITTKLHGENHEESAVVYDDMAKVYFHKQIYKNAVSLHKRSLNIRMKLPNRKEEVIAKTHFNIGRIRSLLGNYKPALESHLQSLELRRKIYGDGHEVTAESYFQVGQAQQRLCEYSTSMEMYERAIRIGPEYHPRTAACCFYKGVVQSLRGMGGHAEALKSHKRALKIRRNVHGMVHQDTLLSCCYVGRTQLALENNESALRYYRRALAINETLLRNGEESGGTAEIYFYIGMAEFNSERYGFALGAHTRFLEIRDAVLSQSTTNGVEEFASLTQAQGLITCTRASLERISDAQVAISHSQIGTAQAHDNEDYGSALVSHQRAYDIRRRIYGEDHDETQDSYKSLQLMKSFLAHQKKKNS